MKETNYTLQDGNWNKQNKVRLEKLIEAKAFRNNYAVFDWDQTCIFYDAQDNIFIYQIENLCFNLTPELFAKAIRFDIPQNELLDNCINTKGEILTVAKLSADIDARYKFIYNNYNKLNGSLSLNQIITTEEYIDFKAKIICLMHGVSKICDTDIAQIVSTGMKLSELNSTTELAIDKSFTDEIKEYTIQSSNVLTGESGIISTTYKKGIRIRPEMQNLVHTLINNGITPYVCTASQEDVVKVFATNQKYGYGFKAENVFGRRREFTKDGKLDIQNNTSIPKTRGRGKAEAIKKLMVPKHDNKPPILIAGDSDGDFFMMDEFKNDSVILIINTNPKQTAKIYPFVTKGLEDQKNNCVYNILVQAKNNATGCFCNK